ncbi:MAG TPA: carboxypeptidase regulatory-like domain-containing protein, partial [Longimicrobiales bacterium]|nr:carboxypeptidase regulatory-like domain-containing protein [Longimicrobiales bacterium]
MASKQRLCFSALCMAAWFVAAPAWAQNGTITGVVRDADSGRGVATAKVDALTADGRSAGSTLSNADGRYRLNVPAGAYQVSVEMVGYAALRMPNVNVGAGASVVVDVELRTSAFVLNPVIVSASRRQERATDAPARVEVVTEAQIRARPAVSAVDHLRGVPGVDVITQGVQGTNVTTRGFNNIFSGSLHMLTDHRLAGVPSLRVNIPYFVPTTNEDLERMEVVLGPG